MSLDYLCEICSALTQPLFQAHGYWIRGCARCGHRTTQITVAPDHIEKVYADDYFLGGEAGYSDYFAEREILRSRGRWYGSLLQKFVEPGTVLDVGTAAGFILEGFQDRGWNGWGIEPNANLAEFAANKLGLRVQATSLESFRPAHKYDLVSMIQVVAHFVDVREALRVTTEVTRTGALLLIETWNWRSWTARFFGKSWHEYSPPSVLRWFAPVELESLAGQFGFKKIGQGRPAKSIGGSHAKSLLAYKVKSWPLGSTLSALTRLIPDRLEIPYPADDLFWMVFQKS
jgi:2-polyprenyl-3-methyl-5-hydroxy-6-metoxy-1,4-benzoquinol methylase